jgi:thioredoxin reductase
MTSPAELPLAGKLGFKETTKENLMQFWQKISSEYQVEIRYGECVQSVVKESSAFVMKTNQSEFKAQFVLLALGRRGTPRKLGVPGEELSKVIYSLTDPSEHINKHVLVVGGGDSALEAAVSISEEKNTTVSLSYRGDGFMRAKPKNRDKVSEAQQKNAINVLLKSNVDSIEQTHVNLRSGDEIIKLKNDIVIVNAGGILPTAMLKSMGISIDTKFGTA